MRVLSQLSTMSYGIWYKIDVSNADSACKKTSSWLIKAFNKSLTMIDRITDELTRNDSDSNDRHGITDENSNLKPKTDQIGHIIR